MRSISWWKKTFVFRLNFARMILGQSLLIEGVTVAFAEIHAKKSALTCFVHSMSLPRPGI